jgi:hypothetical protein
VSLLEEAQRIAPDLEAARLEGSELRRVPDATWTRLQECGMDTWFTAGLKGTGSNDIVVDEVFVPDRRSQSHLDCALGPALPGQVGGHLLGAAETEVVR